VSNYKLTKSKFTLEDVENPKQDEQIKTLKRMTSLNESNKSQSLNFSKSNTESHEEILEGMSTSEYNKVSQTNRYYVNFKKGDIEIEKKRLENMKYGPIILVARNKKEYYKIMSFRRHSLFKLDTLQKVESRYRPEDRYFEAVKDFKKRILGYNEKNIRSFLRFFYFEE
jgi:hypothetical protein